MRSLTAALLYPDLGLLEQAISVGRGTARPLEWVGAPYIGHVRLAEALNRAGLAGIRFALVQFVLTASVHAGQRCRALAFLVVEREQVERGRGHGPGGIAGAVVSEGVSLVEVGTASLAPAHVGGFATGAFLGEPAITLAARS